MDVAVNDMLAIEGAEGKVKAEALHLLLDAVSAKLAQKQGKKSWEPPSYSSDSEAAETVVEADAVSGGRVCFGTKSEGRPRAVGIRLCVVAGIRDIHRPSSAAIAVFTRSRQREFSEAMQPTVEKAAGMSWCCRRLPSIRISSLMLDLQKDPQPLSHS